MPSWKNAVFLPIQWIPPMGRRLGPTYGSKRSPESPQRPRTLSLATLILIGLVCIGPSHGQWMWKAISACGYRRSAPANAVARTWWRNWCRVIRTSRHLLVRFPTQLHPEGGGAGQVVPGQCEAMRRRITPLDPDPTRIICNPADSLDIVLKVPRRNISFRLDNGRWCG